MFIILSMLDQFYDYLKYELNRSPLTVEAYRNDISQFQTWLSPKAPESIDFKSITPNDVRAWLASLARQGITSRSIRRKNIALRGLFRWMMKCGIIKHSPIQEVPLPKLSKPLPDIIKPDEIESAISNMEQEETAETSQLMKALIVEILYSLGIRRAELIGINDEDISFGKGEIKVTGKRSKQRMIPVPEKLLQKIKCWQEARDREFEKPQDESPLFVIKGKRISAGQVYSIVHKALGETSAKKKSPHALRHSFASGMLNGGAELDSVREFLGHASLATTQIYTHISLNEIKKAYRHAHPRASEEK